MVPENDFAQQYINDDVNDNSDSALDLSAVLGHNNDADSSHLQRTQGLARPGQSASDTATAALAQYHTMTVPRPTEQAFLNQPTENGDRGADALSDQNNARIASDVGFSAQHEAEQSPPDLPAQSLPPTSKPAVGTDEWHKVRKDNHKEGMS